MTLVPSAASQDVVAMVADRRITDAQTGRVYDELKNKLVVYRDRFVFGFTGFARLENRPVDEWLARVLVTNGTRESMMLIGDDGTPIVTNGSVPAPWGR